MDVVIRRAVDDQEADVVLQRRHVAYAGVAVAIGVVLWGVHIPFCVDGVYFTTLVWSTGDKFGCLP